MRLSRKKFSVKIVNRFVLPATIDGHKPVGVTFLFKGRGFRFRLTVVTVNWGRGYAPGEFRRNVLNVLNKVRDKEYVVLLIQELDEADSAPEKKIFREEMEKGTTLVEFFTREPIAVSPNVPVRRERRIMTMDQGSAIGAPHGTGPRRFFTSCIIEIMGIVIGVGNQHPHRNMANAAVQKARREGEEVTAAEVGRLVDLCDFVTYGGDMNDAHYPKSHRKEKTANERDLDTIRYVIA